MQIGQRVSFYRQAQNLTQRQLAKRLKMAASQLSRYETGQTQPGLKVLKRIARALDVPIADLFIGR